LLERCQPGIRAEERIEQLARALGRQRVQPHLAVVGLVAPGVAVLGTVVHEKEHPRGRHAGDETVQHFLGLGIDPVQILDDQTQGLGDARGQEHLP
jgi:hypothetical protein